MTALTPAPLPAYEDFESAAADVLTVLQRMLGFGLWMVTRTEGDAWIVLAAKDREYGVAAGDVFRWSDSFCSRMVRDEGPRFAAASNDVPAYAAAPIAQQLPIGAYVGVPLRRSDGSLFGTLCAIDPHPVDEALGVFEPLVEAMARLLSTVLEHEMRLDSERRRGDKAEFLSLQDELTGIHNRRAWRELLQTEESRCMRFGHPAAILCLDLDGLKEENDSRGHAAGDALLRRTARVLEETARDHDIVARVGGDEFVVLAVECAPANAEMLAERVRAALEIADVKASVGVGHRRDSQDLNGAWAAADKAMYDEKRRGRTASAL